MYIQKAPLITQSKPILLHVLQAHGNAVYITVSTLNPRQSGELWVFYHEYCIPGPQPRVVHYSHPSWMPMGCRLMTDHNSVRIYTPTMIRSNVRPCTAYCPATHLLVTDQTDYPRTSALCVLQLSGLLPITFRQYTDEFR